MFHFGVDVASSSHDMYLKFHVFELLC